MSYNYQTHFYKDDKHVKRASVRRFDLQQAVLDIEVAFNTGKADFAEIFTVDGSEPYYDEFDFLTAYKKGTGRVTDSPYRFEVTFKTVETRPLFICDISVWLPGQAGIGDPLFTISGYNTPDGFNYENDSEGWVRWHFLGDLLDFKRERGLLV